MANHKILIISVVCLSVAFAGQRPSYMPPKIPLPKPGMTAEEHKEEVRKAIEQHKRQERERDKEYMDLMARQAWIRLLRISESQWNLINPKYKKANDLIWDVWTGAKGSSGSDEKEFRWLRRSKSDSFRDANAAEEMTDCERIAEELIDLLEDEKSTDEAIREKIDALQQFREKARKALPMAKQELSKVLTTPRQEAVFLLLGDID